MAGTTTWAPRTAASAVSADRISRPVASAWRLQNRCARSLSGSYTSTRSSAGITTRSASSCVCASTPAPSRQARRSSPAARCRTATPVTAPVRMAETTVPSITASGSPVSRSDRSTSALARGSPRRAGLSGTLGIHFSPATSNSPPT